MKRTTGFQFSGEALVKSVNVKKCGPLVDLSSVRWGSTAVVTFRQGQHYSLPPYISVDRVALQHSVTEAMCSNLDPEIGYSDEGTSWFYSAYLGKLWDRIRKQAKYTSCHTLPTKILISRPLNLFYLFRAIESIVNLQANHV
jgi:hypothetical protein